MGMTVAGDWSNLRLPQLRQLLGALQLPIDGPKDLLEARLALHLASVRETHLLRCRSCTWFCPSSCCCSVETGRPSTASASECPRCCAQESAVLPRLSLASRSAPASSSCLTTAVWPPFAAAISAVIPLRVVAPISAPLRSSSCTVSAWPLVAAWISAVLPFWLAISTVPTLDACKSRETTAVWPFCAASIVAVAPPFS
eukprot:COSAG06_NODE_20201_length_804_cov_2.695035_1_plen_198_part_10